MALTKCHECGKGISSAALACPHCGVGRPAVSAVECPKCATTIKLAAIVCPHCSFDVAGYRENLRDAKHTKMNPVPVTDEAKKKAIAMVYASPPFGCLAKVLICLGLATLCTMFQSPLPVTLVALTCLVIGIAWLVFPVTAIQWHFRTFDPKQHKKFQADALQLLQNSYHDVACPNCQHVQNLVSWPGPVDWWTGPRGWFDCPRCAKRLLRQDNLLSYIPKPDALVTPNLKAFKEQQANARRP